MHSAPWWVITGIMLLGCAWAWRSSADAGDDLKDSRRIWVANVLLLPGLALVALGLTFAAPSGMPNVPGPGPLPVSQTPVVTRLATPEGPHRASRVAPLPPKRKTGKRGKKSA